MLKKQIRLAVFVTKCSKLYGLDSDDRRRKTIRGEINSSGHHYMSGIYKIGHYVMAW